MKTFNLTVKIFLLQILFCLIIMLSFLVVELFDKNEFHKFIDEYTNSAHYDTNISLVYEGE